jgi:hypothetical protein
MASALPPSFRSACLVSVKPSKPAPGALGRSIHIWKLWPLACAFAVLSFAADPVTSQPKLTGFPFTDEDLNYSISWPTGNSLGEAHLHAKHSGAKWSFSLSLDAGVPGFALKDTYSSVMGSDYCSVSFDRSTSHGSHTVKELETIDRDRATATRNKVDIPVPACVKDALAYLFYSRRELGQGRVPAAQEILFGALHTIRVDYVGAPMISVNGKQVQSDKVTCTIGIGSSDYMFDVYFARDAARTPLLITAPFAVGKFSMELIR